MWSASKLPLDLFWHCYFPVPFWSVIFVCIFSSLKVLVLYFDQTNHYGAYWCLMSLKLVITFLNLQMSIMWAVGLSYVEFIMLKYVPFMPSFLKALIMVLNITNYSFQFSSVAHSCPTLCDPMNHGMPSLPVHHQLPEFTQTYVHRVGDAIQPSHPLSSPSPPAPNPSQHQGLFQRVNSSHEVAKVLEFQPQHQSFQWTPRTDLL